MIKIPRKIRWLLEIIHVVSRSLKNILITELYNIWVSSSRIIPSFYAISEHYPSIFFNAIREKAVETRKTAKYLHKAKSSKRDRKKMAARKQIFA